MHLNGTAHQTAVRWCWVREIGQEGRPHYHWASALGISFEDADGLVHILKDAAFQLSRDDPQEMAEYFHRVSYLAKARTKDYGSRCRVFGCSRG